MEKKKWKDLSAEEKRDYLKKWSWRLIRIGLVFVFASLLGRLILNMFI